jgi:hypothetical protein
MAANIKSAYEKDEKDFTQVEKFLYGWAMG